MYTLSFWRSRLGSVVADLLHLEAARTMEHPFKPYVPGKVTQVSRMTNVHL